MLLIVFRIYGRHRLANLAFMFPRLLNTHLSIANGIFQHNPYVYLVVKPTFLNFKLQANLKKLKTNVKRLQKCDIRNLTDKTLSSNASSTALAPFCSNLPGCPTNTTLLEVYSACMSYRYMMLIGHNIRSLKSVIKQLPNHQTFLEIISDPRLILAERVTHEIKLRNSTATKKVINDIYFTEIKRLSLMCAEMKDDFHAVTTYRRLNVPIKYKILRSEDLFSDRHLYTRRIYSFLQFPYSSAVTGWLDDTLRPRYSSGPVMWSELLPQWALYNIEVVCSDIMDTLGYIRIHDRSDTERYRGSGSDLVIPTNQLITQFLL